MIPSVFISSTIVDLHYVREVARKVVKDFAMNPVMSDYGEIAYMGGNTAESSCYLSVKDCKLMVLIIGKRYGAMSKKNPDASVTECEFDEAQNYKPYLITLVEKDVINFKDVYEKNKTTKVDFPGMDQPVKTFNFIDKVGNASQDNGIFQFSNAEDVDKILRLQFAGLFGRLLDEKYRPEKETIKDILSEVKGISSALSSQSGSDKRSIENIAVVARFLLDERNLWFAKILNKLAEPDLLTKNIMKAKDFRDLVTRLDFKYKTITGSIHDTAKNVIRYEAAPNPDWFMRPYTGGRIPLMEIGWISSQEFALNMEADQFCRGRFQELKDKLFGVLSEKTSAISSS